MGFVFLHFSRFNTVSKFYIGIEFVEFLRGTRSVVKLVKV